MAQTNTAEQMEMAFMEEGGLQDDGANVDAVSGNEVPSGSMDQEVRDDVPAMLSEGEYVVPADVVRFHGVKLFEQLRDEAKMGMGEMEQDGRIGGEPIEDELPFDISELEMADEPIREMAEGGEVGPTFSYNANTRYGGINPSNTMGYAMKTFTNASTGRQLVIPFFNGQAMSTIPQGFVEGTSTTPESTSSQAASAGPRDTAASTPYIETPDRGITKPFEEYTPEDFRTAAQSNTGIIATIASYVPVLGTLARMNHTSGVKAAEEIVKTQVDAQGNSTLEDWEKVSLSAYAATKPPEQMGFFGFLSSIIKGENKPDGYFKSFGFDDSKAVFTFEKKDGLTATGTIKQLLEQFPVPVAKEKLSQAGKLSNVAGEKGQQQRQFENTGFTQTDYGDIKFIPTDTGARGMDLFRIEDGTGKPKFFRRSELEEILGTTNITSEDILRFDPTKYRYQETGETGLFGEPKQEWVEVETGESTGTEASVTPETVASGVQDVTPPVSPSTIVPDTAGSPRGPEGLLPQPVITPTPSPILNEISNTDEQPSKNFGGLTPQTGLGAAQPPTLLGDAYQRYMNVPITQQNITSPVQLTPQSGLGYAQAPDDQSMYAGKENANAIAEQRQARIDAREAERQRVRDLQMLNPQTGLGAAQSIKPDPVVSRDTGFGDLSDPKSAFPGSNLNYGDPVGQSTDVQTQQAFNLGPFSPSTGVQDIAPPQRVDRTPVGIQDPSGIPVPPPVPPVIDLVEEYGNVAQNRRDKMLIERLTKKMAREIDRNPVPSGTITTPEADRFAPYTTQSTGVTDVTPPVSPVSTTTGVTDVPPPVTPAPTSTGVTDVTPPVSPSPVVPDTAGTPSGPEGLLPQANVPVETSVQEQTTANFGISQDVKDSIQNNPGNIKAGSGFAGQTGETYGKDDPSTFAVFDSPEMGLRALVVDMKTKAGQKGIDGDVEKMLLKYLGGGTTGTIEERYKKAKGNVKPDGSYENENPEGYIAAVKKALGGRDKINVNSVSDMTKLIRQIIINENKPAIANYYLGKPAVLKSAIDLSNFNLSKDTSFAQAKQVLNKQVAEEKQLIAPAPPPKESKADKKARQDSIDRAVKKAQASAKKAGLGTKAAKAAGADAGRYAGLAALYGKKKKATGGLIKRRATKKKNT